MVFFGKKKIHGKKKEVQEDLEFFSRK